MARQVLRQFKKFRLQAAWLHGWNIFSSRRQALYPMLKEIQKIRHSAPSFAPIQKISAPGCLASWLEHFFFPTPSAIPHCKGDLEYSPWRAKFCANSTNFGSRLLGFMAGTFFLPDAKR